MAVERGDVKKAGERIYMARVMWKLNDSDKGKMVVIDVDSGDYEVDADEAVALERLLARRPDARAWPVKFQGQRVFRGGWRLSYPNGYTIEGGYPSREEIREALDEARHRNND